MTRPICELVSKIFYEPDNVQLLTSTKREGDPFFEGTLGSPLSHPIAWIDTSAQPRHVEQPADWNKTTLWNAAEVEAVLRLLERLSENAALVSRLAAGPSDAPIGVICMYSAQKVKIEQAFSSRPWEARFRRLVRIETVDSYQGKENTIVIVSLVRCNNGRLEVEVENILRYRPLTTALTDAYRLLTGPDPSAAGLAEFTRMVTNTTVTDAHNPDGIFDLSNWLSANLSMAGSERHT